MAILLALASAPPQNPKAAPGVISALSAALEAPGIIMQSYPLAIRLKAAPYPQHCWVVNPLPKKKELLTTRTIFIARDRDKVF